MLAISIQIAAKFIAFFTSIARLYFIGCLDLNVVNRVITFATRVLLFLLFLFAYVGPSWSRSRGGRLQLLSCSPCACVWLLPLPFYLLPGLSFATSPSIFSLDSLVLHLCCEAHSSLLVSARASHTAGSSTSATCPARLSERLSELIILRDL